VVEEILQHVSLKAATPQATQQAKT
jgi:hypothetical protein